ncbi:MAG: cation diffusion facilitator family transporter [Cocleimonas sp.]|nr:cation diffusion facilitator family transporter [Cocleimonas sp.]
MTEVTTKITVTSSEDRYKATRNVTLVGLVVNVFLSLAQLIGGFFTHSQALIADGIHTLSDLASDVVVLVAAKMASKDADDDHPYGHGRFETVATVILGLALAGVAVGIGMSAIGRLMNPERLTQPAPLALLFAALAIISKEGLYHYTMAVANRINSKMLKANAWHHRSDAISSVLVALGVAGSVFLEIPWLDSAAAVLVAGMIFYMGARLILDSTMELVDTALDVEKTAEIKNFIGAIEGVEHMHLLRTRKMGNTVLADVHLQVNSYLSVSEGHFIAENVIHKLRKKFPEMHDITVHIDPEDDETVSPSSHLLSRNEIMAKIYPHIKEAGLDQDIRNIVLHYIDGKIEIEIFLSGQQDESKLILLKDACKTCDEVRTVNIHQQLFS